jgi:hypothetical protein
MSEAVIGNLRKMRVEHNRPVDYYLPVGDSEIHLNPLLGSSLRLEYSGIINCIHCGRVSKKSFNQGFCYPCFTRLAQCDSCIVSPEKCHYHLGTCREPEWAADHCMQDHYVYLANSSGVKVGITRGSQIPVRWIDQGAMQALPIIRVATRQQSGLVEVAFKQHVADKTNWRAMLKGEVDSVDLLAAKSDLLSRVGGELDDLQQQFGVQSISVLDDDFVVEIEYPVINHPSKVVSFNFDKTPVVEGVLEGIKGQYLILEGGVINIRKFAGYQVSAEIRN